MPTVTIAYHTGRMEPRIEWFFDSLATELGPHTRPPVIVVDFHASRRTLAIPTDKGFNDVRVVEPKPNIWQGAHRVTREDWWAMSNARNTSFALCQTDWIACLDDRCVLEHGWFARLLHAMHDPSPSVLAGAYTKLTNMKVENGVVVSPGTVIGKDGRRTASPGGTRRADGSWTFGCCFALPLAWALEVNGFEEGCDGLSFEDAIFGLMLKNTGKSIWYDPTFAILEDRSPEETSTNHSVGGVFKRTDKGVSPKDKSHAMLTRFGTRARTEFTPDLVELRRVLAEGGSFPIPDPTYEYRDWYDGELVNGL